MAPSPAAGSAANEERELEDAELGPAPRLARDITFTKVTQEPLRSKTDRLMMPTSRVVIAVARRRQSMRSFGMAMVGGPPNSISAGPILDVPAPRIAVTAFFSPPPFLLRFSCSCEREGGSFDVFPMHPRYGG